MVEEAGRQLPDKIVRAVKKQYQEAYMDALLEKAREMGVTRAEQDADLHAVDHTGSTLIKKGY